MAAGDVTTSIVSNVNEKCMITDGTSSYAEFPWVSPANQNYTIFVRYMDGTNSQAASSSMIRTNTDSIGTLTAGGEFDWRVSNTVPTQFDSDPIAYDIGVWHTTAIRVNTLASTFDTFADGVLDDEATAYTGTLLNSTALFLGYEGAAARFWKGAIAEVKIFYGLLTNDEILKLHRGEAVLHDLKHLWNFNDGTFNDQQGSAHGTNHGAIIAGVDEAVAAQIKSMRTTANDKYLITGLQGGQFAVGVIEEAP